MQILFQTIGVLVQYNWALPYYIVRLDDKSRIKNLTNTFSYIMGGWYYHRKSSKRIIPFFEEAGVARTEALDRLLRTIAMENIKRSSYDCVHLNRYDETLLKLKPHKIFTLHGSLDMPSINYSSTCKKLASVHENVDVIIAPSNHCAKTLRDICGLDAKVIYHGVDVEIFNPFLLSSVQARRKLKLPLNKRIILWVARISPEKNLEMMLKALEKITKQRNDVLLLVKGRAIDKNYMLKIKRLVTRLNLEPYITFDLRWTPNMVMMNYYYRAADLYVHTSVSEAFGLTVAEAMACGTPVIAYKSAVSEIVGNGGYLIEDSDALAEKILMFLNDEKLRQHTILRALERVHKEFTLYNMALKYLNLYKEL